MFLKLIVMYLLPYCNESAPLWCQALALCKAKLAIVVGSYLVKVSDACWSRMKINTIFIVSQVLLWFDYLEKLIDVLNSKDCITGT